MKETNAIIDAQLAAVNIANALHSAAGPLYGVMPTLASELSRVASEVQSSYEYLVSMAKRRHLAGESDVARAISYGYCLQNGITAHSVHSDLVGLDLSCPKLADDGGGVDNYLATKTREQIENILLLAMIAGETKKENVFGRISPVFSSGLSVEYTRETMLIQHWNLYWTIQISLHKNGPVSVAVECNYEPFCYKAHPADVGFSPSYLERLLDDATKHFGEIPDRIPDEEMLKYVDDSGMFELAAEGKNYTLKTKLIASGFGTSVSYLEIPEFGFFRERTSWEKIPAVIQHLVVRHLEKKGIPVNETR